MPRALATPIWPRCPVCARRAGDRAAALRSAGGPAGKCADVLLVASELVTNAVMHSSGEPGHLLSVCVSEQRRRVLISVHDASASRCRDDSRSVGHAGADALGRRLVAQLAERWGEDRPEGYRVWAEVPLSR